MIQEDASDFQTGKIKAAFEQILSSREYSKNACVLGKKLVTSGGVQKITDYL